MTRDQTAVGVLDLTRAERLAMINPDRIDYGASGRRERTADDRRHS